MPDFQIELNDVVGKCLHIFDRKAVHVRIFFEKVEYVEMKSGLSDWDDYGYAVGRVDGDIPVAPDDPVIGLRGLGADIVWLRGCDG